MITIAPHEIAANLNLAFPPFYQPTQILTAETK